MEKRQFGWVDGWRNQEPSDNFKMQHWMLYPVGYRCLETARKPSAGSGVSESSVHRWYLCLLFHLKIIMP